MANSKNSSAKTAHQIRPRLRKKPLDLVLFGATGFTGKLVARYLAQNHERLVKEQGLRWGIAGRTEGKLRQLRDELAKEVPELADLPLVVANINNEDSLAQMAQKTEVICTTVGPYSKYGSALVEACIENDTDYCDLTGEVHWIWRMIQAHQERATQRGVRIVNCCGFDSIPSDLGTFLLQKSSIEKHGRPCSVVNFYLVNANGGFSGGTASSMLETMKEVTEDPKVRRVLGDPFSLAARSSVSRPKQRQQNGVRYAEDLGRWTGPFIMARVNERVVRRSNMLLDHYYGQNLRYSEAHAFADGPKGLAKAAGLSAGLTGFMSAMLFKPTRGLLERYALPASGEGPTEEQMDRGFFKIKILGHLDTEGSTPDMKVKVALDWDPGYKGTAIMLSEAACCLALEGRDLPSPGGILTPASAMGDALLERLRGVGMTFEVEE